MILYSLNNRGLKVWYLDPQGTVAELPSAPVVYSLISFEGAGATYIGSSQRLAKRLTVHFAMARNGRWRGHTAAARLLAPVVARRRRALVLVLDVLPGADRATLRKHELGWMIAAAQAAVGHPDGSLRASAASWLGGDSDVAAGFVLAQSKEWPSRWLQVLRPFFRAPRPPLTKPASRNVQRPAPRPSLAAAQPARQEPAP